MKPNRFKAMRAHLGVSQRELASMLGGCDTMWGQYEGGYKVPSADTLVRIAALGINMNWLFTGKGPMLMPDSEGADQRKKKGAKEQKIGVAQIAQQVDTVLASMSDHWLPVWEAVVGALEANPEGLSLEALEAKLPQLESKRLSTELERMSKDGIVGGVHGKFRLLKGLYNHDLNTAEFRTLIGVRELLTVHLPIFSARSGKGRIDIAAIHLKRGAVAEVGRRIWRLIEVLKATYAEQPRGVDESQLRLVISMVAIEPREGTST